MRYLGKNVVFGGGFMDRNYREPPGLTGRVEKENANYYSTKLIMQDLINI